MKARTKIFVVDDDSDIVELMAYNLKKEGYEIVTAGSGLKALWEVTDAKPDAILLDIMMPSPNGYELCGLLKSLPEFQNIPIVIVSARSSADDILQARDLGATAFLPKPFSMSTLTGLLEEILQGKEPACHTNVTEAS